MHQGRPAARPKTGLDPDASAGLFPLKVTRLLRAEAHLRAFLSGHSMAAEARVDAEMLHQAIRQKLAARRDAN